MTKDREQAIRLLVDMHGRNVRRSLVAHLRWAIPVPALNKALKTWERKAELESIEAAVSKIVGVMNVPVIVTRPVGKGGEALDLVSLADAGPRFGMSSRTLYDLCATHPQFPEPFISTTVGRLWVFDDIASFVLVHRPDSGWKVPRQKPKREKETET